MGEKGDVVCHGWSQLRHLIKSIVCLLSLLAGIVLAGCGVEETATTQGQTKQQKVSNKGQDSAGAIEVARSFAEAATSLQDQDVAEYCAYSYFPNLEVDGQNPSFLDTCITDSVFRKGDSLEIKDVTVWHEPVYLSGRKCSFCKVHVISHGDWVQDGAYYLVKEEGGSWLIFDSY